MKQKQKNRGIESAYILKHGTTRTRPNPPEPTRTRPNPAEPTRTRPNPAPPPLPRPRRPSPGRVRVVPCLSIYDSIRHNLVTVYNGDEGERSAVSYIMWED